MFLLQYFHLDLIVEDLLSQVTHQIIHVVKVVNRGQRDGDRFVGLEEMPEISTIVVLAGGASALVINGNTKGSRVAPAHDTDVSLT